MLNDRLMDARAGPAGTLEALLYGMDALRERFKAAVARLIGSSAARAVAALVRLLIGAAGDDGDQDGAYTPAPDGHRAEDGEDVIDAPPAARPTLLEGLAAGLLAVLSWLAPLASWAGTLIC